MKKSKIYESGLKLLKIEVAMKKMSLAVMVFIFAALTFFAAVNENCWGGDGYTDKVAFLKKIEGLWTTKATTFGRGNIVLTARKMEFKVENSALIIVESLQGLSPQQTSISFDDMKFNGESLTFIYPDFQGQGMVKSRIKVTVGAGGKIEAEATTTGSTGRFVTIEFMRK